VKRVVFQNQKKLHPFRQHQRYGENSEGNFTFKATNGDEFIPYPRQDVDSSFLMKPFFMDRFPVTNAQYKNFIETSHYKPSDPTNYLKHWKNGQIKKGEEQFPVVYVSYEDARAYAKWAGKTSAN
jgi:formylglycine-generating enzyme required for sulfatase activity